MVAKAHLAQRVERAGAALCARDARQGERQFHVRQDGLVGDEIVGLEDEPDAVVTECVPVAILVFLGRDAVDDEVARVVVVEPMMLSSVVFPEPDGPRIATNSLSRKEMDTSSSAVWVKLPVV